MDEKPVGERRRVAWKVVGWFATRIVIIVIHVLLDQA